MVAKFIAGIRGTSSASGPWGAVPTDTLERIRVSSAATRAKSGELPAEVSAAIEACHVVRRSDGEDGAQRVVIQFAGLNQGWMHSIDGNRTAVVRRWPELSEAQVERALRFLDEVVAIHLRGTAPKRKRRGWVTSFLEDDRHEF